nr:Ig-like domain-containing protein [Corynebacterium lactis]
MKTSKRIAATAATGALLIGGAVVLPQAMAGTQTSHMNLACQAMPSAYAGAQDFPTDSPIDVTVNVDSPETVKVGDEIESKFSINPVSVPLPSGLPMGARITEAWRMKLDFQLPDNVDYVSGSIDESKANIKGFKILRVNESGNADANGRILRLADANNSTIANGPNSNTSSPAGVRYTISGSTLNLTFPEMTLRTKATKPGAANFGVRTAGASGQYANDANFLTMGASIQAKVGFFPINLTATVRCSPRALANANSPLDERASRLAVVKVEEDKPAQDTSVSVSAANAIAGRPTNLTATVTPGAEGTVVFTSGEMTSATIPVSGGKAVTQMTFPTAGSRQVTATFTPANPKAFNASSGNTTVAVVGQDSALALEAPATINVTEGKVAVSAAVDSKAEGEIAFQLGDGAIVTEKIVSGGARAELPLDGATGIKKIKATYKPSAGSPFAPATQAKDIDVKAAPVTAMTLSGAENEVEAGTKTVIVAKLTPAQGTTSATGKVTFTVAGKETVAEVKDNAAQIEVTPAAEGDVAISAVYAPADKSQSEAKANTTLRVVKPQVKKTATQLTVDLPDSVEKGKNVSAVVTVNPASAAGTVSTMVGAQKVEAPVEGGKATLPLTFPQAGAQNLTFTFAPSDPDAFTESTNNAAITVTEPGETMPEEPSEPSTPGTSTPNTSTEQPTTPTQPKPEIPKEMGDLQITPGASSSGELGLGTVHRMSATVSDKDGSTDAVFGTLKVLVDGAPAKAADGEAQISVVGGKATWDMDAFDAGTHVMTLQFFDEDGNLKASKNVEVTVKNVPAAESNRKGA